MIEIVTSLLAPLWKEIAAGALALIGAAGIYLAGKRAERKNATIKDQAHALDIDARAPTIRDDAARHVDAGGLPIDPFRKRD